MENENRHEHGTVEPHICRANLGRGCVCNICGTVCHTLEDDSKGIGSGLVHRWCTRCNAGELFYDDTGTTLSCSLWPEGYDHQAHKEWKLADYLKAMERVAESRRVRIPPDQVVAAVSKRYGLSKEELRRPKRTHGLMAEARRVTAYLLREVSGLTFTEIGDFFSKDHSFALYIIKKVDDQMQNDTMFKESIIAVLVSLTG